MDIEKITKEEREKITAKISEFSSLLKDINQLSELMVEIYSYRQQLVDSIALYSSTLLRLNISVRSKKVDRLRYYTFEHDVRLDKEQKTDMVLNDIKDLYESQQLLENHIDYLKESVKTIDNLCFGIKHRTEIYAYLNGHR